MKLDLDPERLRAIMRLWRDLMDMKLDLSPGIRSHLFVERGNHLRSVSATTANWLTVLRACEAPADAKAEFDLLIGEILEMQKWAMGALVELKVLEMEAESRQE
jgi:hypothetical protein